MTPDGTRLFVTNGGAGTVTKIDTATNGVTVAAIKVGNGPSSIAVSPDGMYAYVTNSTDNTVSVITLSYNVVKTITGVGTSPTRVVVAGGKVYVSNLGGTVAVISAASNTVTGQVTASVPRCGLWRSVPTVRRCSRPPAVTRWWPSMSPPRP